MRRREKWTDDGGKEVYEGRRSTKETRVCRGTQGSEDGTSAAGKGVALTVTGCEASRVRRTETEDEGGSDLSSEADAEGEGRCL